MIRKYKKQILTAAAVLLLIYLANQTVFFHDREFERAVRETMYMDTVSQVDNRRKKPLEGIIWRRDLEKVTFLDLDFREYKVKDISDLKYFKNIEILWLSYSSAYRGDISVYEEEHILDNLYKIKNYKSLRRIHLYHLKINGDIEAMFPNAKIFID